MEKLTILHLADIHLGIESYGRLDPATGLNSRLGDFLANLDQAIDEALHTPVDLVLFAGDAYKTRDPSPTYQREFASRIARLSGAGIPTFLLVGNHDLPAATGKANTLDIFHTLQVPHVTVGRRPEVFVIETGRGGHRIGHRMQIVALPWMLRSALLTKDEFKNKTLEELDRALVDKVEGMLRDLIASLNPSWPAVLAAHCTVMGASYGSERNIMLGQDIALPRGLIANPAFDYVALGHIHQHQVISNRPLAVYPGSLDRIDFGEEKEPKGYVVAEVSRGEARFAFRRAQKAREFATIRLCQVEGCRSSDCRVLASGKDKGRGDEGEDPLDEVRRAIDEAQVRDKVVRVLIHTTPEREARLPDSEIRRYLKEASYIAAITKQVDRPHRVRFGGHFAAEMTPLQALGLYLEIKQTPPERQKRLLQYAEALMREGVG